MMQAEEAVSRIKVTIAKLSHAGCFALILSGFWVNKEPFSQIKEAGNKSGIFH